MRIPNSRSGSIERFDLSVRDRPIGQSLDHASAHDISLLTPLPFRIPSHSYACTLLCLSYANMVSMKQQDGIVSLSQSNIDTPLAPIPPVPQVCLVRPDVPREYTRLLLFLLAEGYEKLLSNSASKPSRGASTETACLRAVACLQRLPTSPFPPSLLLRALH